jgi:energy-coupling factor transport system permease protein
MPASIRLDQYIPGQSLLHDLDPRTKIAMSAVFLAGAVNMKTMAQLVFLAGTALTLICICGINLKTQWAGWKPFIPVIILTALMSLFLVRGELAHRAETALKISLTLITVLVIARIPALTTPPLHFMRGLEKILGPLARVGFPVQEIIMIMGMALSFIPVILEEARYLAQAQAARGAGKTLGFSGILSMLVPLFQLSLQRAVIWAEAMEARGYTGQERSHLYELGLRTKDYWFFVVLMLWLTAFLSLKTWG